VGVFHYLSCDDSFVKSIIFEERSTHFLRMNEEFLDQLAIYELMDCKVDTTNPLYKQFRLKKITEKYPGMDKLANWSIYILYTVMKDTYQGLY